MGYYNHSIPVDANIMVSITCPIIGEQVAVNFVAQLTATCFPMIGQFIDTMMLASTGIEWL